jgi:hypothetical protein
MGGSYILPPSFADDGTPLGSPKLTDAARKALGMNAAPLFHGLHDTHRANLAVHRASHGFSERDDFQRMNPVYFETRFRTDQPVIDWPLEFVILSAFPTTGQSWTQDQNEAADQRLESELRTRAGWLVRIFGYSPTSGHTEPSWAIDLPLQEGCNIGQRFLQDAIYHVKNDELSVVRCGEQRALVRVGSFRQLLDPKHSSESR